MFLRIPEMFVIMCVCVCVCVRVRAQSVREKNVEGCRRNCSKSH